MKVQGQWTQGKNKAFLKISAWNLSYDQFYTNTGQIEKTTEAQYFNLNVYAAYGVLDKLDIIGYIPFFSSHEQVLNTANREKLSSLGDIDLGLRYGILKNDHWALSTSISFGLPTGTNQAENPNQLNTGDGEFNQLITADIGYSSTLKNLPFYSKTYLGFNNRTNGFSDEIRAGLEFGLLALNQKLWGIARLNYVNSLKNGDFNQASLVGNIFGNNVSYTSYGFEGIYKLSSTLGASFGIDAAFNGRNIAASPSFSGGIIIDLK